MGICALGVGIVLGVVVEEARLEGGVVAGEVPALRVLLLLPTPMLEEAGKGGSGIRVLLLSSADGDVVVLFCTEPCSDPLPLRTQSSRCNKDKSSFMSRPHLSFREEVLEARDPRLDPLREPLLDPLLDPLREPLRDRWRLISS